MVAIQEDAVAPGSRRLTDAVGAYLYKLMAYKDEYEVARLMLNDAALAEADELVAEGGELSWRLHPPMLRALGLENKIGIGQWATPLVARLAKAKRLRNTVADPFRWAEVRVVERELPDEYISSIESVVGQLGLVDDPVTRADGYERAIEIAQLPDLVRGYEDIKLRNVARYRQAMADALSDFRRAVT